MMSRRFGITLTVPHRIRSKWREAERTGGRHRTAEQPTEQTPPELEDAQLALVGRVDLRAAVVAQHLFAQFIYPEHRDRERQQEGGEALGIGQMRGMPVKPTRFVVTEGLFHLPRRQPFSLLLD